MNDANKLQEVPLELAYRLLNPGCVVLVSTGTHGGRDNLLTIAWNMPARKDPPTLALVCSREHFSYPLLSLTRELGINLMSGQYARAVHGCGSVSGFDVGDKFERFALSRVAASRIQAPLVAEAVAHLECRIAQEVSLGSSALLVVNVIAAAASAEHFVDGHWRLDRGLTLLHHLGGGRFSVSGRALTVGSL